MATSLEGLKFLVVDDNAVLRSGLVKLFSREGALCLEAEDGAGGLQAFRENQPDFCVVDIMMEAMDGFQLCAAIRELRPDTPVIILSARREPRDRIRGLELGADDYLVKPFSPEELMARVRNVLKRLPVSSGSTAMARRFRLGALEVDPERLEAWPSGAGGRKIVLTRREVRILQLLFMREGRVVSRDELLDFAWGREYTPASRALDQAVAVLRKKIEADPARPAIIRTVRGGGYRYSG